MHISMLLFLDSTRVAFVLFFLNKNYSLMIVFKKKKKKKEKIQTRYRCQWFRVLNMYE